MNDRLEAIRSEKQRQGLSDTQLADMCDLSHSTVSRAFSGKTDPSEYTLNAMETALGTNREPKGEPTTEDITLRQYQALMENRIARMRAFYNMLLAEKDRAISEKRRWIIFLVALSIAILILSFAMIAIDAMSPNIGWIRRSIY